MATSDATSETAVSEILLHGNDLLPVNDGYLKPMSQNDYERRYGKTPNVMYNRRRIFIVLPFHYKDEKDKIPKVIPIPFIVDTGAIEAIYLGKKARNILKQKQIIEDLTNVNSPNNQYRMKGTFYNGEKLLPEPVAEDVPPSYENSLEGDVRINLLGAQGMDALGVNIEWTKIFRI